MKSLSECQVMIVDDDEILIDILVAALEDDYQLSVFQDGQSALEGIAQSPPDLILLDIMMPVMDGYEVCRRLKADFSLRDIPVIFVTSLNEAESETTGLELGAIDYIAKPINPAIVKARVRNHLELKRYQDILKKLSFLDGLTGILNRRYFDQSLDMEWRRSLRNGTPLSLIMMDIDFFKQYTYGHTSGDDCLKKVASTLNKTIHRPADFVARYGGEEFVCLLPETERPGALFVAEKFQHSIKELAIPHTQSRVSTIITLSIGVETTIPNANNQPTDLIAAADQRLYEAKRSGRNRIVSASIDTAS
ncbi:MAG: diguanylate cyclase [Deltaproteobacteria bacterium]|nr:diguanylate cyclase [Deltaproteobacteria bacterium]